MNQKIKILILLSLLMSAAVNADVPAQQVKEVEHLFDFIKNSGCIINRNGTDYQASKAKSHIDRKYDYFRDDIHTTKEFIELSATKSTMSSQYYTVTCPGEKTRRTQDWLLDELKRFRLE